MGWTLKSPEIVRHLASVLGKEKQSGAAITYWREAVALAPYDPDPFVTGDSVDG